MKFTINGFSQSKLIHLELDNVDSIILRWLVDFASTGKMVCHTEQQEDGSTKVFHWVNYSAVIADLPCINITNVRAIGRRFSKLIKAGLLERKVIKSIKGTYTYFRILENALNDLQTLEQTSFSIKKNSSYQSKNSHREEQPKVSEGEVLHPNPYTATNSAVRTSLKSALPRLLENTTKRLTLHTLPLQNNKIAAARVDIESFRKKCQETSSDLIFRTDFYPKAVKHLQSFGLDLGFTEWLYRLNTTKKPKDPVSYFLSTFFEEDIAKRYLSYKIEQDSLTPDTFICRACKNIFIGIQYKCPECGLTKEDWNNETEIGFIVWKRSLSQDMLEQFDREYVTLVNTTRGNVEDYNSKLELLKKKFGYSDTSCLLNKTM
jgi:hypothetical protein